MSKKRSDQKRASVTGSAVLTQRDADRFRVAAKKYAAAANKSQKTAQDTLKSLGLYTPTGKLAKRYG
ncbi:MAG: hypothetical protein AB7N54_13845 [Alphaproteobacteria bacterium]